ncbi:hypothetical protein S83_008826, partial [Arachis hypogaea]
AEEVESRIKEEVSARKEIKKEVMANKEQGKIDGTRRIYILFINSCFSHCQSERQDTWFAKNSPIIKNKRRRERINERLRTLQSLIPNETKMTILYLYTQVDIRTMLEEAVHYVKFLQLQIK